MLNPCNLDNCFIGMPLIGVKIKQRQEFNPHVIKHRRKSGTPVAYGGVGNLNVKGCFENKADISERVFAEIEHRQHGYYQLNRVPHSLKIVFSEQC